MIRVQVKRNQFGTIAARLGPAVAAHVQATGERVAQGAAQRSRRGATGDLAGGWEAKPVGAYRCDVVNGTFYWRFHEYGTRKMAAHPMVHPAVEAERAAFYAAVARALQPGSFSVPMF